MTSRKAGFTILAFAAGLFSQGLDPAKLGQPPTDSWPTYNGDYSGRRFSTLSKINAQNIGSLSLAWVHRLDPGNSSMSGSINATPLLINGVLYFSLPDHVWAVDARTGRQIWHYVWASKGGIHLGNRGVGVYGNWLYFETPDAHVVSLNAKDGSVRWKVEIADVKLGYFATMAPLIIRNHVIVGVSGDVTDIPGYLLSLDPETGKSQWRWYTEPKPGEPGAETWPKNPDAITHGGGMTWMTGTYDPGSNLLYWGTGNPNPVLVGDSRPGDNLYTCSIVALNPDTGKLVWHFQPSPHDTHDWDAVETPVVFDGAWNGKPAKLLAQASRNGYFFVLDRVTGKHLLTSPFIETNWAKAIDQRGEPVANPEKEPHDDGTLVQPGSDGATNWMSPSYSPETGLFYVVARRIYSMFYRTAPGKAEGWGGTDMSVWRDSSIRAIDYRTGKIVWTHDAGEGESGAGILTTAGGVLFTGDTTGNTLALDARTGRTLWHTSGGARISSSPMTYELDGRQYIVQGVGSVLYAWALPDTHAALTAQR